MNVKRFICLCIILFFPILASTEAFSQNSNEYSIHINRVDRTLYVLKSDGTVFWKAPCGIGRGGITQKKDMADYVTPTGEFLVDIILYKDAKFDAVSEKIIDKYKHAEKLYSLVSNQEGLNKLFSNMNQIDFDKDDKADKAYGVAYIGLDSNDAITGPKMKLYNNGVPYWFSIALHGTPDEDNIGKARSGGCIHISKEDLSRLVENGITKIGTKVTVADGPPKTK